MPWRRPAVDADPDLVGERLVAQDVEPEGERGRELLARLLLERTLGEAVPHEPRRLLHQLVPDEGRRGTGLRVGQRVELLHGERPHPRGLDKTHVRAGGERDEVARAVEGVVLADPGDHGRLRVFREPHPPRLGQREGVQPGVFGIVGGERAGEDLAPSLCQVAGDPELLRPRDVRRVHRDVARARLLAVRHLRDVKDLVREPH